MPETGLRSSPRLVRGALVQLVEDVVGVVPNVIPFQYNPETLTRKMTPWNPFEVDQTAYDLPPERRRPRSFMHAYTFKDREEFYWDPDKWLDDWKRRQPK